MKIDRLFTASGKDPFDSIEFVHRISEIKNPNGKSVFKMEDVIVPKNWSQVCNRCNCSEIF